MTRGHFPSLSVVDWRTSSEVYVLVCESHPHSSRVHMYMCRWLPMEWRVCWSSVHTHSWESGYVRVSATVVLGYSDCSTHHHMHACRVCSESSAFSAGVDSWQCCGIHLNVIHTYWHVCTCKCMYWHWLLLTLYTSETSSLKENSGKFVVCWAAVWGSIVG